MTTSKPTREEQVLIAQANRYVCGGCGDMYPIGSMKWQEHEGLMLMRCGKCRKAAKEIK